MVIRSKLCYYCPQTELREGNGFTGICLFTGRVVGNIKCGSLGRVPLSLDIRPGAYPCKWAILILLKCFLVPIMLFHDKDSMGSTKVPCHLFILVQRCTYLHQCRKLWYVQMSKHNWHYALIKKHCQLDLRLVLSLRFTKEWLQSVLIAETFITEILWLKLQLIQVQINLLKWSHGWDMIVPLCCRFAWWVVTVLKSRGWTIISCN